MRGVVGVAFGAHESANVLMVGHLLALRFIKVSIFRSHSSRLDLKENQLHGEPK
jgi:hypothetical protein